MPKYIVTYHLPTDYVPTTDTTPAWSAYFDSIRDNVVDPGQPVFAGRHTLGETGPGTRLGGYSVLDAADLDEAIALAESCPSVSVGGGVQMGELAELPADHPASILRAGLSTT